MRLCPFFKAFLVTADVLEIYMQEFWATAIVHHHSIRNANAYKEYYAVATGATPPKPKASTHISQASGFGTDEGTGSIPGVPNVPTDESEKELSWNSTNEEGDDEGKDGDGDEEDEGNDGEEGDDDGEEGDDDDDQEVKRDDEKDDEEEGEPRDEESFDPIPKTPEDIDDEGNGEENLSLNVGREEGYDEEEEEDELYRDVNINQGTGIKTTQEVKDSHVTLTLVNPDGQQQSLSVSSQFVTSMLNPTLDVEEPMQTTFQMEEPSHPEFDTCAEDQPIKHYHPEACGRPSTGCRKLPEEAQPNKAGYNKDKKNRLMRIDELHKFNDETLIDVCTALDDRLKGI
nr:hypothetical protein [Tanacetum cinerariifolium]